MTDPENVFLFTFGVINLLCAKNLVSRCALCQLWDPLQGILLGSQADGQYRLVREVIHILKKYFIKSLRISYNLFWFYYSNSSQICSYFPHPHTLSFFVFNLIKRRLQFGLPVYFWVWGHPLEHGQPIRSHTLRENCFPLLRSHQVSISSSWRLMKPSPFSPRTLTASVLCRQ